MNDRLPRAPAVAAWFVAFALPAYLFGFAVFRSHFVYSPAVLALFAVCYASLGLAVHGGALLLRQRATWLLPLGSLGWAAVAVWHCRELVMYPLSEVGVLLWTAGVAVVHALLVLILPAPCRVTFRGLAAAAVSFVAVLCLGFYGSNDFRWHLLVHNRSIGTPAYYALARPVADLRQELWVNTTTAALPLGSELSAAVRPVRPRHLVFILIDTLRADALAAYGGDPSQMPRLNAYAGKALLFRNVWANASWTRPSVASFLTGLLPEAHGAIDRGFQLLPQATTLAEVLSTWGYATAAFVSNYANVGIASGFAQGFDHFAQMSDHADGRYIRAEMVNERVLDWLDARGDAADQPVFLYVHYLDPHTPYLAGGIEPPLSPKITSTARIGYEWELHYTDERLAELLAALRERLGPHTAIFIVSDHGEEFDEHDSGGHGHTLYKELLSVPAILHIGNAAGTIDAPLEGRDFFDLLLRAARDETATIASAEGARRWAAERVRRREGRRFASVYTTTQAQIHRPFQAHVCMRGIESREHFYTWSAYGDVEELFDLRADPAQLRNVASSRRELREALRGELEAAVPHWSSLLPVSDSADTMELLRALGYVE